MTVIWYIILAILAFGAMIVIHELGHFLTARAFGVTVHEFSLGMGPRLFGWKGKNGTAYNLRLVPFGGYVSMKGEDEEESGSDSFSEKAAWKRFIIVAAGAVMNLLLGLLISFGLVSAGSIGTTVVTVFAEEATSDAWLKTGDEILSVGDTRVHTYSELRYAVLHEGYQPVDVTVLRDGEKLTLAGVVFPTAVSEGMLFGQLDFGIAIAEKTVGKVLKHTWFHAVSTVRMIWDSLFDLIGGRVPVDSVSGPVGVTEAIGTAASTGAYSFFYLICVLTVNLGVFNLLPFPALDGGRLVFILFEMLFRRKVPQKFEGAVHFIGIVLLLGLMVLVTFKDVIKLFG